MNTIGACIWLSLASVLAGAEPSLIMQVEAAALKAGAPFPVRIEARGHHVGEPQLPTAPGIEFASEPRWQATQMTWRLTDKALMTRVWEYTAVIRHSGEFEIPPARAQIDGTEVESNPVTVSVASAGSSAPLGRLRRRLDTPLHQRLPTQTPGRTQATQEAGFSWDEVVFATSETDKQTVYLGESVTLTFSLWRLDDRNVSVGSRPGASVEHPTTEGFYATSLKPTNEQREHNGLLYQVSSYSQTLYPTRSGTLRIGHWRWEGLARAATRSGFQRREVEVYADPIDIEVKPLPPDRPQEFEGAVGRFDIALTRHPNRTVQGEPMTVIVTISGQGNPFAIAPPEWRELEHAYVAGVTQRDERQRDTAHGVEVEKRFEYTVIPTETGQIGFPPLTFSFFDPEQAEFITKATAPFTVEVSPPPREREQIWVDEHTVAERYRSGAAEEGGLASLAANPGGLRPRSNLRWYGTAAAVTPVVAFLAFAGYLQRRRSFHADEGYVQAYHATRLGKKQLARVMETPDPAEALYRAMADFVARRFGVRAAGLTSRDAQQLLDTHRADPAVTSNICRVMRACERARYAGESMSLSELGALKDAAEHAMNALDIRSMEKA